MATDTPDPQYQYQNLDKAILLAAKAGDPRALRAVILHYGTRQLHQYVKRYSRVYNLPAADQQDLESYANFLIVQQLEAWKPESGIKFWQFLWKNARTYIKWKARDLVGKDTKGKAVTTKRPKSLDQLLEAPSGEGGRSLGDTMPQDTFQDPEQALLSRETSDDTPDEAVDRIRRVQRPDDTLWSRVEDAIEGLRGNQRAIMQLLQREDLNATEIAKRLDISLSQVLREEKAAQRNIRILLNLQEPLVVTRRKPRDRPEPAPPGPRPEPVALPRGSTPPVNPPGTSREPF